MNTLKLLDPNNSENAIQFLFEKKSKGENSNITLSV